MDRYEVPFKYSSKSLHILMAFLYIIVALLSFLTLLILFRSFGEWKMPPSTVLTFGVFIFPKRHISSYELKPILQPFYLYLSLS